MVHLIWANIVVGKHGQHGEISSQIYIFKAILEIFRLITSTDLLVFVKELDKHLHTGESA